MLACAATLAVLTVAHLRVPAHPLLDGPAARLRPPRGAGCAPTREGRVTGGFRYLVLGEQFGGKLEVPPLADWPTVLPERLADGARGGRRRRCATSWARSSRSLALLGIPLGLWRRPREVDPDRALVRAHVRGRAGLPQRGHHALLPRAAAGGLRLGGPRARRRHGARSAGASRRLARGPRPHAAARAASAVWGPRSSAGCWRSPCCCPTLQAVPGADDRTWTRPATSAARRWLDATLAALPEDAVVVSWWSYSTPLWYGTYVEGRRPDITVIDDRDIVDERPGRRARGGGDVHGGGDAAGLRRPPRPGPARRSRRAGDLEPLTGVPPGEPVYRVIDPVGGG